MAHRKPLTDAFTVLARFKRFRSMVAARENRLSGLSGEIWTPGDFRRQNPAEPVCRRQIFAANKICREKTRYHSFPLFSPFLKISHESLSLLPLLFSPRFGRLRAQAVGGRKSDAA
ncbi:MAG: hypothetical protein LBJ59_04525 [Zoogloeaceae bacterium]|jgi:hypothetical protein|nr:hypothetical protein [Zoogloeaceae bacterium]